jgi:fructokinase
MNYNTNFESNRPTCVGIGLVALDVLFNGKPSAPLGFYAGGSCGNVMTILSFLGWEAYPIARLRNNEAGNILLRDLEHFGVNNSLISSENDGSTPIIIHRILKDREGKPKHRFEFRDPETGSYLPSYKPVLSACVDSIFQTQPKSNVFYLDRVNRASIEMAKKCKSQNALIFFEPSSYKDDKNHNECLSYADVVKFSSERISNYQEKFPVCTRELEVMTMGSEGLVYRLHNQKTWTHIEAYTISSVVDAAGSGDWCTAGLIHGLFNRSKGTVEITDKVVEDALEFGQALAALNCCFMGARGAMYALEKEVLLEAATGMLSIKKNVGDLCQNFNEFKPKGISEERRIAALY